MDMGMEGLRGGTVIAGYTEVKAGNSRGFGKGFLAQEKPRRIRIYIFPKMKYVDATPFSLFERFPVGG